MTIILFIAILGILVLVHEGGHFLAAKLSGVRVDEFGFGFPPRLLSRRRGETLYSVNLLPFGGFVRIAGEEGNADDEPERNFSRKPLLKKLGMLLSGVGMNWLLAAVLFGVIAVAGAPVAVPDDEGFAGASVTITGVAPGSPAQNAGLSTGDTIVAVAPGRSAPQSVSRIDVVQEFLRSHGDEEVQMTVRRGQTEMTVSVVPRKEPPDGEGPLGVSLARVAFVSHPWYEAWWRGAFLAGMMTVSLADGFVDMLRTAFTDGELAEGLSGPVGIAALTGEVRTLGFIFLLNFIALLSLNLALINVLPIPALDGGRVVTVVLEKLTGKRIPTKALAWVHAAGFIVILFFVMALTVRDVRQLL